MTAPQEGAPDPEQDPQASEMPQFPNPFTLTEGGWTPTSFSMRTLEEVKLNALSQSIREKPRWWHKVHDDGIVANWRTEAAQ